MVVTGAARNAFHKSTKWIKNVSQGKTVCSAHVVFSGMINSPCLQMDRADSFLQGPTHLLCLYSFKIVQIAGTVIICCSYSTLDNKKTTQYDVTFKLKQNKKANFMVFNTQNVCPTLYEHLQKFSKDNHLCIINNHNQFLEVHQKPIP